MSSKYQPVFVKRIVELGAIGLSYIQIAAELDVSYRTMLDWAKDPEKADFAEAYKLARERAEAFREQQLIDIALGRDNKKGNAPAMMYYMKCRFGDTWKDISLQKIDMTTDIKKLSNKDIDDQIKALLAAKVARSVEPVDSGTPQESNV